MYKPNHIIDLIADNVRKTKNPLGISTSKINTWWKDIPIKRDGNAMLFTGLMYQLIPYIDKMTQYLEKYEETSYEKYIGYAKYIPKFLYRFIFGKPSSKEDKEKFDGIVKNIVQILTKSGVDFYYKPELDFYSGILLYDLGDNDGFIEHARFVVEMLRKNGVKKLITVDPHTTYALKVLYPKYLGTDFDVKTYFEVIDLKGEANARVTIHDPCFYGRYLELSDVPREVLKKLGIECVEVRNSGKLTLCCGGPAESISPKLSKEIATKRIEELKSTGCPIVGMCPICIENLRRAGAEVEDLSTLILKHI
ncbi:MAG: (Fe-S)-binding protein [Archaeoglobaceae archaeon]|nr:(Fe-S)-binding protein [Archaeoglobaceae archaeon]